MESHTAYADCPCCFESSGYVWEHGNDWNTGPWSNQTNIPCRECNGTGLVECETRSFDDLTNEADEALASLDATLASLAANRIGDENIERAA